LAGRKRRKNRGSLVARIEPTGPAFGGPDDRLSEIRDGPPRMSLRSIRATAWEPPLLLPLLRPRDPALPDRWLLDRRVKIKAPEDISLRRN
jgi:hypothetical protein